jgi:hypothetical protein
MRRATPSGLKPLTSGGDNFRVKSALCFVVVTVLSLKMDHIKPGVVALIYNPSYSGGRDRKTEGV